MHVFEDLAPYTYFLTFLFAENIDDEVMISHFCNFMIH